MSPESNNHNPAANSEEILPLTGLRAFAAWWVVSFHSAYMLPLAIGSFYWFARLGDLGVDLFFVLSGFVISYRYLNSFTSFSGDKYRKFLWLRLARLYPVHIFTLLISALLLLGVKFSGMVTPKDFSTWTLPNFVANVFMVHAWRMNYVESWNNASWSISCEWFAYLVFPLLVLLGFKKIPPRFLFPIAILVVAIYPALAQAKYALPFGLLVKVVTEFAAGSLVYLVYAQLRDANRRWNWLSYVVTGLFFVTLALLWKFDGISHDWLAVLFPLAILAVALAAGPLKMLLGSRPAVYWGKVSYSLYMTHNITLWLLKALLPVHGKGATFPVWITYIVAISVVAMLTYHFVEEPSRKWMRSRKFRRNTVALAEA